MYDAIVVGARCAGSPTAMLLARRGYRVLLVDRALFPSDTLSTHWIWPPGVACLKHWGLWDRILAGNCPFFRTMVLDLGEFRLVGEIPAADGTAEVCTPRRTVLDKILLDAAAAAGAEIREGCAVTDLLWSDGRVSGIRGRAGGEELAEHGRLVIGADGRASLVARKVGAAQYKARPAFTCVYYAYWRDVAPHLPGVHLRPQRLVFSFPTHDGLTVMAALFPREEFHAVRADPGRHLAEALGLIGDLAEPYQRAERAERLRGTGALPNFFRQARGPGWALVGDAGYHKDPILGQGISDAFRSAQWLADAVHAGLSGQRPLAEALAEYQCKRDAQFAPIYDLTCNMATLEPPPDMLALYQALRANPAERNRFFGTLAGTVPIPEYYAPENIKRIVAEA